VAIDVRAKVFIASAGGLAALWFAAPAGADPALPPAPEPAVPTVPEPAQAGPTAVAQAPVDGIPHLPSPDAPPPGSTMDPSVMAGAESPNVSYLRDLWQAVQSQEISGKEALLLGISQRNLNTPIPAQAPGPNVPITPGDPVPAPAAPPASAVPAAPAVP
jgi:hypothetical protein